MSAAAAIRLVTQFDPPSARPAAATPSCCCCSCCSCCVVTTVAASIHTARNAQHILHKKAAEAPARRRWIDPLPGLVGFFALPIAIIVLFAGAERFDNLHNLVFLASLGVWYGFVGVAYLGAGHQHPWLRAAGVVGFWLAIGVVEFGFWYAFVSSA